MELTLKYWQDLAEHIPFPNQAYIDGKFTPSQSGAVFDSINPATNKVITSLASCDEADVNSAVAVARKSFNSGVWSRRTPAERKAVLLRLSQLILENQAELAVMESLDMGKPVMDAYNIDVAGAAAVVAWYAELCDKVYDEIAPTGDGSLATITREPLGVIAAVVPWNFPLDLTIWKVAPALAAGNSMVVKPSVQSSMTALKLAELATEAGLPDGVLNVVTGSGRKVGAPLGLHMDVDCLTFTGSTEVGKQFLKYSGESNMKACWLETGGKSPNVVFADCDDLDLAADKAAWGIFFNQGEVCSACSRLIVEKSIKDEFVAKLIERAKSYQPADPLDPSSAVGAMVDANQVNTVMSYIQKGKEEGADLLTGGEQVTINGSDNFVQPTIFDSVTNDMTIAREEIFGPVLSVITFETEEEAIAIANDSPYGLAASLWTDNLSRAHRVARALKAGTVSVNTMDALSPMTPFGGFKESGIGRDLSIHALDKFTEMKTTWIEFSN